MKILHDITTVNTATATTEASGYPIENATDIKNFKQWRSTTIGAQTIVLNFTGTIDSIAIFGANFASLTIGGVAQTLIKDDLIGDYRGFFPVSATSSLTLVVTAQTPEDAYFKISAIAIGSATDLNNVVYPFNQQLVNPNHKISSETGKESKKSKGQNYRLIEVRRAHLDYDDIGDLSEIKQAIKKSQTFVLFADDSNVGECYLGTRVEPFEYRELDIDSGTDNLILEETGGTPYNLRVLIEIELTSGTLYYSTETLKFPVSAPVNYKGRVLSSGSVKDALQDDFSQFQSLSTTTISLDNLDGTIKDLNDAEDFRGKAVNIKVADLDTDTVLKTTAFTIEGFSHDTKQVDINLERAELDVWHIKFPKEKFNLTDWPDIPDGSRALDTGIPEYYGYNYKVPCYYVSANFDDDEYDYIIGKTGSDAYEACNHVYRDGVLVNAGEYTFYDGSQVSPYPGYAFIRFASEQKGWPNLYLISADIQGYQISGTFNENPVDCFEHWLENSLGLTVNSSSFSTASTVAGTLSLKIGGGIAERKEAIDWRTDWLLACRCAEFKKGASGYEIVIPTYQSTTDVDLTDDNAVIGKVESSKASSYVNNITVKYYYSPEENSFLKSIDQTCGKAFGTDKEYQLDLVNDDATASRIAKYLRNLFLYGDETLTVTSGRDVIDLEGGEIAGVTTDDGRFNDSRFKIKSVDRKKSKVTLKLQKYSSDIFEWAADSYQGSPPSGDSLTTPDNVSSLSVTASKTVQNDGSIRSIFTVTFTAPTANFQYAKMFLKVDGGTYSEVGTCAEGRFEITNLTAGLEYYVKAVSWNGFLESAGVESAKTLAVGDTTAPATPANFATTNIINGIQLTWDANTENDFKEYEIYRDAAYYKTVSINSYQDLTQAYSTTYTYKIRSKDLTGNVSEFTSDETGTAQKATESQLSLTYGTAALNSSISANASAIALKVSSTDYEPNDVVAKINSSSLTIRPADITLQSSGKIILDAGKSIEVTSGDINVGSGGDINIATGGDIIFTGTCGIYSYDYGTRLDIYPDGTLKTLRFGGSSYNWNAITATTEVGIVFTALDGEIKLIAQGSDLSDGVWVSLPDGLFGTTKTLRRLYRDGVSGFVKCA